MALTNATANNRFVFPGQTFGFVELRNEAAEGPPKTAGNRSNSIKRPGLATVAVRVEGTTPDSFAMITGRDVLNFAAARTLLAAYDTYGTSKTAVMYYGGVRWGTYAVLSVNLVTMESMSGGSGGFHGASAGAYLTARWELVQVGA